MASVKLADLTNEITPTEGTGILDVLVEKFETRLNAQYDSGRITGSEFATVYVQGFTELVKSSIGFLLEKDKAATDAMIGEATVVKQWGFAVTTNGDGDLVLGASTGQGIIDHQITEAESKIDLTIGQVAKVYADVAFVGQQQETELAQTADPTGGVLKGKFDLIAAQSLGFASDTKQKVLKQMFDAYAVTLAITDLVTAPGASKEPAIDALVHEILQDVGSTATINALIPADIGTEP